MEWAEITGFERTRIPELTIIFRLAVASLFGAVIGFDREVTARPAGLRTHMLVALAAAAFTIITFELAAALGDDPAVAMKGGPDPHH